MKYKIVLLLILFIQLSLSAQNKKPKLIVGIVVDQMRYDYLLKFYDNYGDNGFKKLMNEGFSCNNLNYNYKPTYTGPGHASIFTGATPSVHGIVGNNWYDRGSKENVYCVTLKDSLGKIYNSPERLLSETFADGLRQFTNFKGKAYGVSLKDRGAILPAGHLANGAYWFNSLTGEWESSQYYSEPNALKKFNLNDFSSYLKNGWKLSLPKEKYAVSFPDDNNFEFALSKTTKPVFPYNLVEIQKEIGWGILKKIPQGNQMTADAAKFLIEKENLGKDATTDFISVSFSATDYVGHRFGVQSMEVHDTYVKLDNTLADFIQFLDEKVGKEEYTLFLTADHGGGMPLSYLKEKKIPHGKIDSRGLKNALRKELIDKIGNEEWIEAWINLNVYFNDSLKREKPETFLKVKQISANWLKLQDGIAAVLDAERVEFPINEVHKRTIRGIKGYCSGDLICIEKPNWSPYTMKGSTHGSAYAYDTHVPLELYGKNVTTGNTNEPYSITSIMSTLSALTGIPFESAQSNIIIEELFE